MKIKKEKQVLQAFCSPSCPPQMWQEKPFMSKRLNMVCATDGHYLLMVDPKLVRGKYDEIDCINPDIIRMKNNNTIVTIADIEAAYNCFKLEPEMVIGEGEEVECSACEGDGEVQWEFTDPDGNTHYMDHECPVCGGTGKVPEQKKIPTGRMLAPEDALLEIDGVKFSAYYLMTAIEAVRMLGCKQLRHTVAYENSANIFEVQDGIRLLIMPSVGEGQIEKVITTKDELPRVEESSVYDGPEGVWDNR